MTHTRQNQPMFNAPAIVVGLVVVLLLIFFIQDRLSELASLELVRWFGFVPGRITIWFDPQSLNAVLGQTAQGDSGGDSGVVARYFIGDGQLMPWSVLTYAFLHGSWAHVLLNCLWLLSFGAAVARRFGSLRFILFFCVTAIAGAMLHYFVHPLSALPVIGASAAVSGCMGAAMRFAFAPGAPLGERGGLYFLNEEAAYHLPAPGLGAVLRNSRAMVFFAVWFIINLVFGVGSTAFGFGEAPIAWEAHIGGLLAGIFLFPLFDGRNR